jgi:hypothetical protein
MADPKRSLILNPQRIGLAEQMRQDWVVNAEEGTAINDVLDPAYWAHCSGRMQVYDRVDVRLETGEWLLELIVLDVGRNYARMFLAKHHEFVDTDLSAPVGAITHKVQWMGPQRKHGVVRLSDSAVIQEGIPTKEAAAQWLDAYLKTTTAPV